MEFRVDNFSAALAADTARDPLDLIHTLGTIKLPPAFMVKRFGKHDGGDGNQTSGGWTFVGADGAIFTVNEMRRTTLWHGKAGNAPTPRDFWRLVEPVQLDIGGYADADWQTFREWLRDEYRAFAKTQKANAPAAIRSTQTRDQLSTDAPSMQRLPLPRSGKAGLGEGGAVAQQSMSRAAELHDRAHFFAQAADEYASLASSAESFLAALGDDDLGDPIDPALPARLKTTLEDQIRPAQQIAWSDYLAIFGCKLGDRVRVETKGMPPEELVLSNLTFSHPHHKEPFVWATGPALKQDHQPGKKTAVAKLHPGKTKIMAF